MPTGKSGFCVPQNQCIYIQDLIKNLQKPLPGDVALYIKDSFFCPKEAGVKRIIFSLFVSHFHFIIFDVRVMDVCDLDGLLLAFWLNFEFD